MAAATGYTAEKLRRLGRSHLVTPVKGDSGPCYDALDAELVKVVKKREDAGLPLDFTIKSIEMYREAMESVVRKNTRRVLTHLITDVPVEEMGAVLREVEDSLDALVLLMRQKAVRRINEGALGELNAMGEKLQAMVLLPIAGAYLPHSPPADPGEKMLYDFLTGDYQSAMAMALSRIEKEGDGLFLAAAVLCRIMLKEVDAATALVEHHLPEPGHTPLVNAVAALTYVSAAAFSAGITGPMRQIKKAWPFLESGTRTGGSPGLHRLLTRYICGAVYAAMPEILGFREKGLALLAMVRQSTARDIGRGRAMPEWMARTLAQEILPAAVLQIDRLLAPKPCERASRRQIGVPMQYAVVFSRAWHRFDRSFGNKHPRTVASLERPEAMGDTSRGAST